MEVMFDMLYSALWYSVLLLTVLVPILWQTSARFKFSMQMIIYYGNVFVTSLVLIPVTLLHPFDPENYKWVQWVFQNMTQGYNVKWDIDDEDADNLTHGDTPCIYVANHQSSIDLMGMMAVWPRRTVSLIKKSLMYAGPFGISSYLSGSVFIDRFDRQSAVKVMQKTVDYVKDHNVSLWVFPEGTRNHEGLLPFKKGAFHLAVQAQIPIVPVVFSSYLPWYSKKDHRFHNKGYCKVRVLSPISTKEMTADDVTSLAEGTREKMATVFKEISIEAERIYLSGDY